MENGKRDNNLGRDTEESKQKAEILFTARSRPTDKQHSWLKAIEAATKSQEAADRPDRHLAPKAIKYFEEKSLHPTQYQAENSQMFREYL